MVTCKWLFKHTYHVDETFAKYKVQLVARGFSQVEGFNYAETFSPMVKFTFLHIIIVLTATYGYHIHQMDVQTKFFHGHFNEEFFMQQPPSYACWSRDQGVLIIKNPLWFETKSSYVV
jgi:hypothetical protein